MLGDETAASPQRLAYWGGPLDGEHTTFRMRDRDAWPRELYTPAHGVTVHPDAGSTRAGIRSHRYELVERAGGLLRYVYRGVVTK